MNKEELNEAIKGNNVVLVDVFAQWCAPCKAIAPHIEKMKNELPSVKIVACDVEKHEWLMDEYGIKNVPTYLFFKGGELVNRLSGSIPIGTIKAELLK